ncbi:MAG: hypothetical protein Q9157_005306 [Trypethelium eluteriae]
MVGDSNSKMKPHGLEFLLFFSSWYCLGARADASPVCVIPAAGDGSDDSPAIIQAFQDCGKGGQITFSANTTYYVQTVLQLHNLSNVQIDFLGTILFSTDVRYWIQHGSYYHFQNISIAMEFSGEYITIDGHSQGVIDGQGQVWYDLALGVGGLFGRPIPFSLRNANHSIARNLEIKQSGKWNFVIIESHNITADNIFISSTSDDFQANPGNLGNTDGFDTLYSDDPGSTNIYVQNLTCVNTAGIAVSSLGQYQGQFDLVENITARDIKLVSSRNGAYIKTYNGISVYYPPQGGGNGTGRVQNVLFENFYIQNITAAPVLIQQCTHWGGYNVPPCADFPATGFTFQNVTWKNFTGNTNPSVGTTVASLACSPKSNCTGFTFTDIDVRPPNGTATLSCTNIHGYDEKCQPV